MGITVNAEIYLKKEEEEEEEEEKKDLHTVSLLEYVVFVRNAFVLLTLMKGVRKDLAEDISILIQLNAEKICL